MRENASPKLKKRIIVTLIVILAVLLVMYLLVELIPKLYSVKDAERVQEVTADYNFYPADYEENIFEDIDYLALINNGLLYYDNGSNSILEATEENAADFGEAASLMINMFYSVVEGDAVRYNSYFSDEYFRVFSAKERFTMQKIYNAKLSLIAVEGVEEKAGNYTKYTFKLEYFIFENNGTYRKDIGEDARTQYFTVTDKSGNFLIDSLFYEIIK